MGGAGEWGITGQICDIANTLAIANYIAVKL